jgi:radical SAM superfamily enzyme YgiQ (UPF0313 family)
MFEKWPHEALRRALVDWRPAVVGLSIRNIDTNDARNPVVLADEAAELAQVVRRCSDAKLVLGGAALGVMPHELLRRTGADYAVVFDGDVVFPQLLDSLAAGREIRGLAGVLAPGDVALPARPAGGGELASCTPQELSRWVQVRPYLSNMAAVGLQTKRGCPFECIYCTYSMAEGHEYRLCPPEQVVAAVRRLAAQGLRDVEFVDNVFNSPYEHALAICRQLAVARLGVRLQSLELNPRFLDDELLWAMEQAGFAGIGVTAESASDVVLAGLKKGYTAEQLRLAAGAVARHAISCVWIFMLGGPGETPDTVQETLEFATRCIRPSDTAFFQTGIRIYPGTPLEQIARAQGVLTAAGDDMLAPVFYISPQMSLSGLKAQVNAAVRTHMNFVAVDAIGLPLFQTVLRACYRLGVRPPVWRYTPGVRRLLKWTGLYGG